MTSEEEYTLAKHGATGPAEQAALTEIRNLRGQGRPLRGIAAMLNSRGQPGHFGRSDRRWSRKKIEQPQGSRATWTGGLEVEERRRIGP
jgi:hypothetical protein